MIWYAAYGSNLFIERFACYIEGGRAPLSTGKPARGCRDRSPPVDERACFIPHRLYFARSVKAWQRGGVAFLDPARDESVNTLGRQYLITREQFCDVMRQENDDPELEIDLDAALAAGSVDCGGGWYARILVLGELDGHPIATFTDPRPLAAEHLNPPKHNYLTVIAAGLRETYHLNMQGVRKYLLGAAGIADRLEGKQINDAFRAAELLLQPG